MTKLSTIFQRWRQIELGSTRLFDEKGFYGAFSIDFKSATSDVLIESPYITARRAREISPLIHQVVVRGVKVSIYTRNPYHHDGLLINEALRGIQILKEAGARVVTCNDMRHRKIAIVDGRILWEGSLNMLSQNGSREMMRRTLSEEMCQQMQQFLGLKWYIRR